MVDKVFCASSYLMFRYVFDERYSFTERKKYNLVDLAFDRKKVKSADDLLNALEESVADAVKDGKVALALSGGIDSAILAKFMPKHSKAYTFRCVVPDTSVTDETKRAIHRAEVCGLDHEIIDIYWEDVERVLDDLMMNKGGPVHSIETQIYICAKKAKSLGMNKVIFGETADAVYGGLNGLLSKDWYYSEFVERYTYCFPYKVLRKSKLIVDPYLEFEKDGYIDGHDFINKYFMQESLGSYINACETAGIQCVAPYAKTVLDEPINYKRIRSGDTKYIVREAFKKLYPGEDLPQKIPMPRPVNEWFANWEGPKRPEFIPHCTDNMTGDQKWMVWCLERFLNNLETR